MPDLIKTERVADSELARPKKSNKIKKYKKSQELKGVKLYVLLWLLMWKDLNSGPTIPVDSECKLAVTPSPPISNWELKFNPDYNLGLDIPNWKSKEKLPTGWKFSLHKDTHKKLNKRQEIQNGNITEHKPDLCFISEANLWEGTAPHEMNIIGHRIMLPNTMGNYRHARIVLLIRDGINVVKLNQFMYCHTATIWVKIGQSKNNCIRVWGIYREHLILGQGQTDSSRLVIQRQQEDR